MKTPIIEGKFYRLTYDGKGIYSALKEASGMSWNKLLKDPDITWLPKPPEYKGDYRSYFTEHGYHMYRIRTSKIMDQYLDKKHVKVTVYNNLKAYVAYRDKYQIVVSKDYVPDKDIVIKTGNGLMVDEEVNSFMAIDKNYIDEHVHHRFCPEYNIKEATNIKVPSGITNFKEFCSKIRNPEMAMQWFVKNRVQWVAGNKNPFQWPDKLIKDKKGNCFDQSVFMHYFLKYKRISHKLFLITWVGKDRNIATGHVIPIYEKRGYVYAWLYVSPGVGYIGGPFESYDDCKDHMDKFFAVTVNGILKTPTYPYSSYMSDEDMLNFDRYYGRTDITQEKFIGMGAGINMRSTHMVKIKFKGIMFPNPALPIYDGIIAFASLMKSSGMIAESVCIPSDDVLTEDKLSADERTDFGLPKKKKYPMPDEEHVRAAIRFFNHCDPEDEAELARNIKKYMKKYNMKDVKVGDGNRFKKYYKGSSVNEDAVTDSMYFKRSTNGIDNAIVDINGGQYRPRAEILVFNSDGEVYLTVDKDLKKNQYGNVYKIPGGGFDKPDETPEQTSARECKEEIRIVPKDVVFTGETYVKEYGTHIPDWHKDKLWTSGIKYRGAITYVCVGKVAKEFKGYVKPVDRDVVMMSGRFYKKEEAMKYLNPIHKKICSDYKWGKYNPKK